MSTETQTAAGGQASSQPSATAAGGARQRSL